MAAGGRPPCDRLSFFMLKGVNKAIRDHRMIAAGDSVAVAVSGGKDSLALVHLLDRRRRDVADEYSLTALHVTPAEDAPCAADVDLEALSVCLERHDVPLVFAPMAAAESEAARERVSPCFHCAWRRRRALFQTADELGCDKIAFGHHADDIAQTTLLNLFFHGRLETMRARQELFDGRLTVIRPLAYVNEKEIVRLARECGFPPAPAPCVEAAGSRRALMAQVLRTVEREHPKAKINLWRATGGPQRDDD